MSGSDMKKAGSCRCNYYRLSSLVVMSFVIVLIYWSMFSSSSVSGQKYVNDSKRKFIFNRNQKQNVVRFKPKIDSSDDMFKNMAIDQAAIPDRNFPLKNRGDFVQENDKLLADLKFDTGARDKARESSEIDIIHQHELQETDERLPQAADEQKYQAADEQQYQKTEEQQHTAADERNPQETDGQLPQPTVSQQSNTKYEHRFQTTDQQENNEPAQQLKDEQQYRETDSKEPKTIDSQQPPATYRQQPPVTDRQQPPSTDRQQPLATDRQQPPATDRQQPLATDRQQPPATDRQQPPATDRRQSPATDRQQSPATDRQQPPATDRQQPPATDRQQPPATDRQQSPATDRQQSPATDRQQSPATDRQQPPATDRQQPPATDRQQPPATDRQQPPATDRLQSQTTEKQKNHTKDRQPQQSLQLGQISTNFKQINPNNVFKPHTFGDNLLSTINKPRNGVSTDSQTDKWIVVTTIQLPTDDVRFLANLEGWKVVVVGDTKTPDSWSNPNCEYLSVEKQKTLGFEIVPLLPIKSYSRKNVGYLFAISKGARVIYETDDDNRPSDLLKHFIYDNSTTGLTFIGGKVFNPYRHFGQPTLWPRGYPLGFIGANVTDNYHLGLFKTPSIQQGVVNGDPDMDALFRLTRKRTEEMLNVSFDAQAPPAILPAGVLAPFNSQNTLFLQDALWAMLIPMTTTFRVCDIWRGYWAQRLLWEIGANIGFFAPNAFQKRNSHSYVNDAKDEKDVYFKTHEFYEFLLSWTCEPSFSFFQCAIKLGEDMSKNKFWKEADVSLIKAWFNDLKKIGYREPKRVPFTLLNPVQPTSTFIRSDDSGQSEITKLTFTPGEMFPPMYYDSKYIVSSYWNRVQRVVQFCDRSSYQVSRKSLEQPTNPDVVLVVVFKDSNYFTIPHLNRLYGFKFPHIAYCGADFKRFEQISQNFKDPVTFVEADVQNGFFSYRCLSAVMKMKYRVNGFMMIGSDTLLNPWVIDRISQRDRIWFDHSDLMTAVSQTTPVIQSWPAWTSDLGKKAFNKAWLHITQESLNNPMLATYFSKQFQKHLIANTKMPDLGLFVGPSDVVYIPSNFTDAFIMYIDMFSKYNVLHEIVVPTVISGLDLIENMIPLNGRYMWTQQDKANYEQQFNKDSAFLHPVQIGDAINTQRGRNFFCNTYLPFVLEKTKSQHRLVDLRNL